MQPHPQTSSDPLLLSSQLKDDALRDHIPWWADLGPGVCAELEVPDGSEPLEQSLDVVVIGGGVAGLSAALGARRAGARVLLLERNAWLGYGATGRNAGILSAGINMNLAHLPPGGPEAAFWPETTRVLLSLVDEAARPGALLSARLTGAISLAESARAARNLAQEARARVNVGLRAEVWTAAQVAEATGGRLNTHGVVAALWLPDEGRIQPLTLLAHLARQARAAGVIIRGRAHMERYQEVYQDGAGHHWKLTLAGGAVVRTRGLISAVGPVVQANARIYAQAFSADLPDDFPLFWDASPYTYADFRPGNGRLTVSGGRYGKAGVTRRDAVYHARLATAARRWLPELADKQPAYAWAVDLAVAADMVPRLRDTGEVAPGVAIEGLGALGVLPGVILGQRAGALVAEKIGKA
ncbi:MAG: FAD-binding oxidoreductase [Chloroflexota bacterium]|nr:FAD-binding oxidoreductase [Chloroflexota bacterium]